MADFDQNRFKSNKQEWGTPPELFNHLNEHYCFDFDLAADESNHKTESYFTVEDNALSKSWSGSCWLNPPYGGVGETKLSKWVEKAFTESQTGNCRVTMLIPARTNTAWWHRYCMNSEEILFINGRPKFIGAIHGLPQPLALVTFSNADTPTRFGSYNVRTGEIT